MINFPNSPSQGQVFTSTTGLQYVFLDGVWRIVEAPQDIGKAEARNRIVNGAMQISQEYAFLATVPVNGYCADQWFATWVTSGAPASTALNNASDIAAGVVNFIRFTSGVTPDTSIAAADVAALVTRIEGTRIADFGWGAAGAKQAVLRFAARCTGMASLVTSVSVRRGDFGRSWIKNVTLTSSWQDFTLVVPGDVAGGAYPKDTSVGLHIAFTGMSGSTSIAPAEGWNAGSYLAVAGVGNVMSAANQTIDLANVGLYLDPQNTGIAPPWQMPDEAEELRACQRYYVNGQRLGFYGAVTSTNAYTGTSSVPVPMRISPALSGTNVQAVSFPATVGGLAMTGQTTFHETRNASATTPTSAFQSNVTANARM